MLLNPRARFDLAVKLQSGGAPSVRSIRSSAACISGARSPTPGHFQSPPPGVPASLVITPGAGLIPPETLVTESELRTLAETDIHQDEPRYREPLERDARMLCTAAGPDCQFILLGSIATAKYMAPLLDCFGDRLVFPGDFVGRGDMSRGGLMLRCAREGRELDYVAARAQFGTAHVHQSYPSYPDSGR